MSDLLKENYKKLAIQYKDLNIQELLKEIGSVGDIFLIDSLLEYSKKWNIETADGVWLDYIGYRLGVINRPTFPLSEQYFFGFDGSGGVNFAIAPFWQGYAEESSGIGDNDYRRFLKVRMQQLITDSTPTSIRNSLLLYFSGENDIIEVIDNYNMTMNVNITTDQVESTTQAVIDSNIIIKPAGVKLTTTITYL